MGKVIQYAGADLYPKQRAAIFDPARIVVIEASTKAGKGQPLDAVVYTPRGPKKMGDLQLGDKVLTPDGGTAPIVGIYPLGERDIYCITFSDGTSTECTEDHIWEIHSQDKEKWPGNRPRRSDYVGWPRLMTLTDIAERLKAHTNQHRSRMWIRNTAAVSFRKRKTPIHPYLLGVLIGDGSFKSNSLSFASGDSHIVSRVEALLPLGYGIRSNAKKPMTFGLTIQGHQGEKRHLTQALRKLNLHGKGSHEKFVPALYRYNDEETRWEMLRGLFDADGFVDSSGQPALATSSLALARDILEILQSLGSTAKISAMPNGYTKNDGTYVPCRPAYWICVRTLEPERFFSLPRKKAQTRLRKRHGHRTVRKVDLVRRAEAQCIQIDHPEGLYMTNDFIVTHNTVGCLAWLAEKALVEGKPERAYWWCSPVFGQADIAFRRMKARLPRAYYKANQSKLTITLANGATLWFKSAERSDDLYGEDVYAVVMDEASRMREESWHAIRSTLTFTQGPVRMIGNVKGRKNFFWQLCRAAEAGAPGMAHHKITAWDAVEAGVLDREEIESAHRDFKRLGREGAFNQLYLAEAADDGDNPFGLLAIEMCVLGEHTTTREAGDSVWMMPNGGYPKAAGVDLAGRGALNQVAIGAEEAQNRDYTAAVLLDRDGTAVHVSRFRKPHTETATEVHRIVKNTMALVDSTGTGDAVVEALQRRGDMRVEGFTFSDRSRQDLLEGLALRIGDQSVQFPDGWLRDELDSFEFRFERRGIRYCVPDGDHDDGAFALALAVKKLPWRRRVTAAPLGVAKPGGSAWTGDGGGEGGDPLLGGHENQPDPSVSSPIAVPSVVVGVGSGKWGGAG